MYTLLLSVDYRTVEQDEEFTAALCVLRRFVGLDLRTRYVGSALPRVAGSYLVYDYGW